MYNLSCCWWSYLQSYEYGSQFYNVYVVIIFVSSLLVEFRKKKLATRVKTLQHGVARSTNVATQANRRPPPLPPGAVIVNEKPSAFNRPPLPAVPRPRPVSSFEHSQEGAARPHVSKSVSLGIIPKVSSAEGNIQ